MEGEWGSEEAGWELELLRPFVGGSFKLIPNVGEMMRGSTQEVPFYHTHCTAFGDPSHRK